MENTDITILNMPLEIPEGKNGPWSIERFTISKEQAMLYNINSRGRGVKAGTYTRLSHKGWWDPVMSDTPSERFDHYEVWKNARGKVLINGLGLGLITGAIALKSIVTSITVIEIDQDLIDLVGPYWLSKFPEKIKIICEDALAFTPQERYDVVWHDIWNSICADNLKEMKILHRKYGKKCNWQGSWCRSLCERLRA